MSSDARPRKRARTASTKARKTGASRSYSRASTFPTETKYFDTAYQATVASTADWAATNIACATAIGSDGAPAAYTESALIPSANGSGFGQVVGNKYMLKALRARGHFQVTLLSDQADAVVPPTIRAVLVLDTQANGAQETGPNVFADMGSAGQNVYTFQQMGAGMPGRFQILGSKVFQMVHPLTFNDGAAATPGTGSLIIAPIQFEFTKQWKRGRKICIKSNTGTAAIANLVDQNIFLLCHATAGFTVTCVGCARAYYCD